MKLKQISIVGMGLMGASLAAACRRHYPAARILGVSRNRSALRTAKKRRWIDAGMSRLGESLPGTDLVVLCTPVDVIPQQLLEIERETTGKLRVTDVGSAKGAIYKKVAGKLKKTIFVGSHPMVGSHEQGITGADAGLYEKGLVFVVPGKGARKTDIAFLRSFWRKLSCRVVEASPVKHDEAVGEISHLPHAVAVCLMNAVSHRNLQYAGRGFLDSTRIAGAPADLWLPIFQANAGAIEGLLARFEQALGQFRRELRQKDSHRLKKALKSASLRRSEI